MINASRLNTSHLYDRLIYSYKTLVCTCHLTKIYKLGQKRTFWSISSYFHHIIIIIVIIVTIRIRIQNFTNLQLHLQLQLHNLELELHISVERESYCQKFGGFLFWNTV